MNILSKKERSVGEKIVRKVGFDFDWDSKKVWSLVEPIQEISIDRLLWHFDYPFWDKDGTDDFNLTPWEVIHHPQEHVDHFSLVESCDVRYPIDVMENKGRLCILDGLHRLVNLYLQGVNTIKIRVIPRSKISNITK